MYMQTSIVVVTVTRWYIVFFQHLAAAGDYQCDQRFHVRDLKDYALQQPQRPVIVGQRLVCTRGMWKTANRFGYSFKNRTVQKFEMRSDGFSTETAHSPQFT